MRIVGSLNEAVLTHVVFLGAMMWCWVVQSTVRHDKLCVRWKGAQLLHIHIRAQLLHIRIWAKNVVNSNLELRKGSFFVDPFDFWLFNTPSVATPAL